MEELGKQAVLKTSVVKQNIKSCRCHLQAFIKHSNTNTVQVSHGNRYVLSAFAPGVPLNGLACLSDTLYLTLQVVYCRSDPSGHSA